jgi:putative phage-type endonuclease
MKIIEVEQGSESWLALRRSKITATDCAAIMGKSRYKSPHMVWLDKMGQIDRVDSAAMKRGRELEPEALAFFNQKYGCNCKPTVALSDKYPWQMASFDGWDSEKKILVEIKCPGEAVFRDAQAGWLQDEYGWQCLHQLAVNDETDRNLLFYYLPGLGSPETVEVGFDRDEAKIIDLTRAEGDFYHNFIRTFIEPQL